MNIREIAKISGCSAATVSRVLAGKEGEILISGKTKEKILKICRQYGYEPSIHASRFFSKQAMTVGIVTPSYPGLEDENLSKFMSAAYTALHKYKYRLLPFILDDDFIKSGEYLSIFNRKEIDALIIWGFKGDESWINELDEKKLPFILASNRLKNYPSVSCDDGKGISALVKRCAEKGAEKFIFVACPPCDVGERRKTAFMKNMKNREYHLIQASDFNVEAGLKTAEEIRKYKPDAIICANDKIAVGVISGLKNSGAELPGKVMITGADNIEMTEHCFIPLSTFDQMAYKCGTKCIEIIMKHLKDGTPLESAVIAPEIYIRFSA
ncbi:MAG: Transcriptional regulator [Candidatus Uhrbacteria bacterium GW2011_GWF2_39_13]|uniref:Transcriptional regulator n=1 Tax=Candidatus Uhrbacteria bacterium GW2011_GWF2_39_13 TaxID=1618995 RepID=A0A0G0ML37_9BACT|nr:MAG: Transcriptional regulator [Candidatus Uhrbacteria bacterium GW2011_GWF2_39_13]